MMQKKEMPKNMGTKRALESKQNLKPKQTLFFYDLETSGLSAAKDRIMQFAGMRTDLDLNPLGAPVNYLVKLNDDTLPSPKAIMVTKITPQQTQQEGKSEAELARCLMQEIFTPGTIAVGYNSTRFDDVFLRFLFWRNFYDPYLWQWQDGRGHWDLLDVVRMTRALRPEGINWPFKTEAGETKASNRLEELTKANQLKHAHAHDALSDVEALVAVTKLIKTKQPQLYNYLFALRDKNRVKEIVNCKEAKPVVYTSGRYAGERLHTSVAFPLFLEDQNTVVMWDLNFSPEEALAKMAARAQQMTPEQKQNWQKLPLHLKLSPICKKLKYNRCPAVSPLGVLEKNDGWAKLHLSPEKIQENLQKLIHNQALRKDLMDSVAEDAKKYSKPEPTLDAEEALYERFLEETDRSLCQKISQKDALALRGFQPNFQDKRLAPLFVNYKGRNFPTALSEAEQKQWEKYRLKRLAQSEKKFLQDLTEITQNGAEDDFIVTELQLWYQSIMPYGEAEV